MGTCCLDTFAQIVMKKYCLVFLKGRLHVRIEIATQLWASILRSSKLACVYFRGCFRSEYGSAEGSRILSRAIAHAYSGIGFWLQLNALSAWSCGLAEANHLRRRVNMNATFARTVL